jgi:hypothetical protein
MGIDKMNLGAFFCPQGRAKKPGFPLQVLGFATANPVGFPLQSLAHGSLEPAPELPRQFRGSELPLVIRCAQPGGGNLRSKLPIREALKTFNL